MENDDTTSNSNPPVDSQPPAGQVLAEQKATEPGGFWIRFLALVIDGMLLSLLNFPASFALGFLIGIIQLNAVGSSNAALGVQITAQLVSYVIYFILVFFYYGWFYKNEGGSPGKLLLGLKVVDASTGAHLNYGRTFLRETIGKILSGMLLLVGYIMAGIRSDKKALHDLIVGSQVIRKQ